MTSDDKKQKLLQKLAKLKALAECPTGNPNETAAAAASMTRLMLEYQIEMAELEGVTDTGAIRIVTGELFPGLGFIFFPKWKRMLYACMAENNDCMAIRLISPTSRNKALVQLLGTPDDIANVRKIFDFVTLEIQRLNDEWRRDRWWASVAESNDFLFGAALAVCQGIQAEKSAVLNENPHALVWLGKKKKAVEAKAPEGMRERELSPPDRSINQEAFAHGYRAGANLSLNKDQKNLEEASA